MDAIKSFQESSNSELDKLGITHNCDKASLSFKTVKNRKEMNIHERGVPCHDYLRKYELFLKGYRSSPNFTMLELGAGPICNIGSSLKIWLEYFPNAKNIKIADIKNEAKDLISLGENVDVEVGDLGNNEFLSSLKGNYDLIIDDASHVCEHQIKGFCALFDSLNQGGIYIIEDIHTSFNIARWFNKEKNRTNYLSISKDGKWKNLDAFSYFSLLSALVTGDGENHQTINNFNHNLKIDFMDQDEIYFLQKSLTIFKNIDAVIFIKHSCIIIKK